MACLLKREQGRTRCAIGASPPDLVCRCSAEAERGLDLRPVVEKCDTDYDGGDYGGRQLSRARCRFLFRFQTHGVCLSRVAARANSSVQMSLCPHQRQFIDAVVGVKSGHGPGEMLEVSVSKPGGYSS